MTETVTSLKITTISLYLLLVLFSYTVNSICIVFMPFKFQNKYMTMV